MFKKHDTLKVDKYKAQQAENERMRQLSGEESTTNKLIVFLYLLGGNLQPIGTIEELIDNVNIFSTGPNYTFTNGWLAKWAKDAASRLSPGAEKIAPVAATMIAGVIYSMSVNEAITPMGWAHYANSFESVFPGLGWKKSLKM